MNIRVCLISCCALIASAQLYAQSPEPWWFDVEVIVFKRALDASSTEKFEEAVEVANNYSYDLITTELQPAITGVIRALPLCPIEEELTDLEVIVEKYEQWLSKRIELTEPEEATIQDEPVEQIPTEPMVSATTNIFEEPAEVLDDSANINQETIEIDASVALKNRMQEFLDNAEALQPLSIADRYDCLSDSDVDIINESFFLVDNQLPELSVIPKRIDGKNWFLPYFPHILPVAEQQLFDFANKIERIRGHQIMHHTVWRQEVIFGRDVAPSMRLVAGENFTTAFLAAKALEEANLERSLEQLSELGAFEEQQPENDFFTQLQVDLASGQPVDIHSLLASAEDADTQEEYSVEPQWELDGEFKVFLKYINGVPYLHIDSELVFQRPLAAQKDDQSLNLQRIPFKQLRRVISQQIHYFDHPLFGLVVQIRRHQRPSPADELTELEVD